MRQQPVLGLALGCLLMPQPLLPQTKAAEIGQASVVVALGAGGIHIEPQQVELLTHVPVRQTNPDLVVAGIDALDAAHARVKLKCRDRGVCLPFFALINWDVPEEAEATLSRWLSPPAEITSLTADRPAAWSVRHGQIATFVIETPHVHLQLPVICLTNGRLGETVRVSTLDRKRVFRGEVVGPRMLKGGI